MTDNWKPIVLAVMLVVFVCCVCVGLAYRDITDVGECVVVQPLEAAHGSISSSGLVFHVEYIGTTKGTGEACSVRSQVTESEYERMIYGEKRLDLSGSEE